MANEDDPAVSTLTLKLPTFWPDKPEAWFGQAEANFRARRITSEKTKFNLVVVALDADTIDGILDLLETPPDDNSYGKLKTRLVQSFKISTVERIKRAWEFPTVADEAPSRTADKIIALLKDATAEDIAKTMFLLKLPDEVRRTMWAEPFTEWTDMKARANSLWHADKGRSQATVYETTDPDTNAIKGRTKNQKSISFREFAEKFVQRANGPCVYHGYYGREATRCRTPCNQAGNDKAGRH